MSNYKFSPIVGMSHILLFAQQPLMFNPYFQQLQGSIPQVPPSHESKPHSSSAQQPNTHDQQPQGPNLYMLQHPSLSSQLQQSMKTSSQEQPYIWQVVMYNQAYRNLYYTQQFMMYGGFPNPYMENLVKSTNSAFCHELL